MTTLSITDQPSLILVDRNGHRHPRPTGSSILPRAPKVSSIDQPISKVCIKLPLLISRGLPTALNDFDERSLEIFIVYLIKCAAALEGRSVEQIPFWWSACIPYNPTSFPSIPNKLNAMRNLVVDCYTYFGLAFYLDLSEYLSNEPNSLFWFNHQADGLVVFTHKLNGLKVTVKSENLTYDIRSLAAVTCEAPVITIPDSDDESSLGDKTTSSSNDDDDDDDDDDNDDDDDDDNNDCVLTSVEHVSPNKLSELRQKYLIPKKKKYSILNTKPKETLTSNKPSPSHVKEDSPKQQPVEFPLIELTDSEDEQFLGFHDIPCPSSTESENISSSPPTTQEQHLELLSEQNSLIPVKGEKSSCKKSRARRDRHRYISKKEPSVRSQEQKPVKPNFNQRTFLGLLGMRKSSPELEERRVPSPTKKKSRRLSHCFIELPRNYLSKISICDLQKLIDKQMVMPTVLPSLPKSFRPGQLKGTSNEKRDGYTSFCCTAHSKESV